MSSPNSRAARLQEEQDLEDQRRLMMLEQQLAHVRWKKMQNMNEVRCA